MYGPLDELLLLTLGKLVGDVEEPAVCGELRGPDHVRAEHVYVAAAGLKLGPELIEVLARVGRHLAELDFEALALLVELVDQGLIGPGAVGPHGKDQVTGSAAAPAAACGPKKGRPGQPRPAELQEVPPVKPPSVAFAG